MHYKNTSIDTIVQSLRSPAQGYGLIIGTFLTFPNLPVLISAFQPAGSSSADGL